MALPTDFLSRRWKMVPKCISTSSSRLVEEYRFPATLEKHSNSCGGASSLHDLEMTVKSWLCSVKLIAQCYSSFCIWSNVIWQSNYWATKKFSTLKLVCQVFEISLLAQLNNCTLMLFEGGSFQDRAVSYCVYFFQGESLSPTNTYVRHDWRSSIYQKEVYSEEALHCWQEDFPNSEFVSTPPSLCWPASPTSTASKTVLCSTDYK